MENIQKTIAVNCSWCNKQIECPEDMLNVEKHMCYECFQKIGNEIKQEDIGKVHIDFPMDEVKKDLPNIVASSFAERVFPEVWRECKEKIKEMSKKEIAEEMFLLGVKCSYEGFLEADKLVKNQKQQDKIAENEKL